MNINKTFSLDEEVVNRLKHIDNQSALVNHLLTKHFNQNIVNNEHISVDQARQAIEAHERATHQRNEVKKQLDALQLPIELITYLKTQTTLPDKDSDVFYSCSDIIGGKNILGIKTTTIRQAHRLLHKGD